MHHKKRREKFEFIEITEELLEESLRKLKLFYFYLLYPYLLKMTVIIEILKFSAMQSAGETLADVQFMTVENLFYLAMNGK